MEQTISTIGTQTQSKTYQVAKNRLEVVMLPGQPTTSPEGAGPYASSMLLGDCYRPVLIASDPNSQIERSLNMARLLRAARVALNIHPNEPSSLWKVWAIWVEF